MNFLGYSLLKRNVRFRYLFIGQMVSFIGTMISLVALPYQVFHETHSTIMVGLLSFSQLLPLLITALLGGVIADRYDRRFLLIVTELLLSLGCIVLAYNAASSHAHIPLIFIVATIMSAINGLHRPALDSMVQQVVDKHDFSALGSLSALKWSSCTIIGPSLGGIIISSFGITVTYLADAFSFLVCIGTLLKIRNLPSPTRSEHQSVFSSLKEGFQYAFSRQELIGTYLVDFVAMVFAIPNALFPAIAQSYGGPRVLGMFYSAPAVGALVMSFYGEWANVIKKHGAAIAVVASLWGLSIMAFGIGVALSAPLVSILFFLVLSGVFDGLSGVFRSVIWNQTIPNEYRGRLAGIEMISFSSGPKLGETQSGFIAALFGVSFAITAGGALCLFGIAGCCYFLPQFLRYHSEVA